LENTKSVTDTVTDWDDRELSAVGQYPEGGFEWRWDVKPVNASAGAGPWLCLKERGPQWIHRYPVLRQRQVLTEFVKTGAPSHSGAEGFLDFANHRGWLGQQTPEGNMVVVEDPAGERFPAEDYGFWVREASLLAGLAECNALIPSLSRAQPAALVRYREMVKEITTEHLLLTYGSDSGWGMANLRRDQIPGRHHNADVLAALVREAVQRKLRGRVSLVFRPERLVFMPETLLGALYLVFAVAMVERRPAARACLCGCGEEFHPRRRDQCYLDKNHSARDRQRRKRGQLAGKPPHMGGQS